MRGGLAQRACFARERSYVRFALKSPTELIAKPDIVKLDLTANSREAALRSLHADLAKVEGVVEPDRFLLDLLERAMVAPVCIAADVALPHARTNAVDRIVLGVARLAAPGVGFDGEHPSVRLMFMVGIPRQQVEEYLQLVAAISRLLRSDSARPDLLAAKTEEQFRALLARGAKA